MKKNNSMQSFEPGKQDISSRSSSFGIFGLIFLVLLALGVISVLKEDNIVSFKGLLDFLANAPQIDLSFLDWSAINLGDWGAFNWLRDFFNIFISAINVVVFVGTMAVQLIMYFLYFLKFIFL